VWQRSEKKKSGSLKTGLESQQNAFRKQPNDNACALQTNYCAAHQMTKINSFSDGEFVKKCLQNTVQKICLQKKRNPF
jgi:hypothetical protein